MVILGPIPFTADPGYAEERVVMILQTTYFPERLAVAAGDTVRFVNASGQAHTVSSSEGIWTTGPIGNGAEATLEFETVMAGRFHGWSNGLIQGRFDLMRAPAAP